MICKNLDRDKTTEIHAHQIPKSYAPGHSVWHVSFMQHWKKICGLHKRQMSCRNMRKYGRPSTPCRSKAVQTHGWCHSVGNKVVEVTKPNRNTNNIKIAVENANLCDKSMRYAHFAEICEKCGNKRNMQQSHIHIKLTVNKIPPGRRYRHTHTHTGSIAQRGPLYTVQSLNTRIECVNFTPPDD